MRYFLNKVKNPELVLKATNIDLMDRWVLRNAGYFMKNEVGNSITAFIKTKSGDENLRKTSLALCEDYFLERAVLAKTVIYEDSELYDVEAIKNRRNFLIAQIEILNRVESNMLPEPLDFFTVTNAFDKFKGDAVQFKDDEPILILDYIPGKVLADKLSNMKDRSFYRSEYGKTFSKTPENINVGIVMRLLGDILAFEMELLEKGFAYTALSPDHIILLGDNKPRFTGLGRICPVSSDRYNVNHVNYGRQLKGFSAPEFNKRETNFGMNESVKAGMAYNFGVLIACIMLGKSNFDERELKAGSYDYSKATEDRKKICTAWNGKMIDSIICKLTDDIPSKRLTDFSLVLQELAIITGDATNEKRKEPVYAGVIKFFAKDKGFGYVTCNGKDYGVDLKKLDYIPPGHGNQVGQNVLFTSNVSTKGKLFVKEFIKPKPQYKWPRKVSVSRPSSMVRPKPTPESKPKPKPKPRKKGLLAWLLDL